MKELELQQIWLKFSTTIDQFHTVDGKIISVLSPGVWNKDQGPDFLFARIEIDGQSWFGHVEIHIKASDWFKHGHHLDSNYSNVVLHVVQQNDIQEFNYCPILVLQLDQLKAHALQKNNLKLLSQNNCPFYNRLPSDDITQLLEEFSIQRLQLKSSAWLDEIDQQRPDWDSLLWHQLATAFGQKVNAETFKSMSHSIPIYLLKICQPDLFSLEALILGQSGLLEGDLSSEIYFINLKKKHQELKLKYGLKEVYEKCHFLRMRPMNFPTIRLVQLASFMHHKHSLATLILNCPTVEELEHGLPIEVSDFWKSHFTFQQKSNFSSKPIGVDMRNRLIINVYIPFLFVFAEWSGIQTHRLKAIEWGKKLPFERNALTKRFADMLNFEKNAITSQGVIHLVSTHCSTQPCCYNSYFTS